MENIWSAYLVLQLIIGFFDGLSDILLSFHLFTDGHPYCGLGILAWMVLALAISFVYVLVGRCTQGDPMTCVKYMLMSLKVHTEIVSAYFQGGPSLIVQLVIVWSGIYKQDFEAFAELFTWGWFWAWLEIFSILTSFVSLVFSTVRYNNEPGPARRVCWSVMSSIFTCMYRAFVVSIMFKLSPGITCIVFGILYLITLCILQVWGDGSPSFLHAFCCLFLPVGHNHGTCAKPGYSLASGIPEAERTRINQTALFKRMQKFSIMHLVYNILLLVPYITFIEIWLQTSPRLYNITPILSNRLFTYLTPTLLLITNKVIIFFYYRESRKTVDAYKVWTQISTNSAQQPSIHNPSGKLSVQNDVPIPIPSSPSRPMSSHTQPPVRPTSLYLPQSEHQSPTPAEPTLYPHLPSAPIAPSEGGDFLQAGNHKCNNANCVTCACLVEGPVFFSMVTNKQYRFMTPVTCTDDLLIYLVTCRGCRKQYVGKTEQTLRQRHYGHRREIETQSSPLGQHFGSVCGYNCWSIQIIDKCSSDELARREGYWQHELRSLVPDGLNIRDELGGRLKI